ncbi:MAG: ATPase [Rubrivivax sp.]|nr:ATPase [Rubrivivax sp.]
MNRSRFDVLVGVDGGGSRTRARLADMEGRPLGFGTAGPSSLALGADVAWRAIEAAIDAAFTDAGRARPAPQRLAIAAGLAGAQHRPWVQALWLAAPRFGMLEVESDACTALLGAHGGAPGAVIAVGTGSIGMAETADGERRTAGGWGFPAGDEGSGAWMGLRAVAHAQAVMDQRREGGPFAQAVIRACGENGLLAWCVAANAHHFASLAPLVLAHARHDATARAIVDAAAAELARIAAALDPAATLPLAWCGGLAAPMAPYLDAALRARSRAPQADGAQGALLLLLRRLGLGEHGDATP